MFLILQPSPEKSPHEDPRDDHGGAGPEWVGPGDDDKESRTENKVMLLMS